MIGLMTSYYLAYALASANAAPRPELHVNNIPLVQRIPAANIIGPMTVPEGQLISVTASSVHFLNPVYQFWIELPDGQYESSGSYTSHVHFTFTATTQGIFHIKVYVRESNAPANESAAQRALYEVQSTAIPVTVSVNPQYPIQLVANEPLVRTGQAITLSASMPSATPVGDYFDLLDTTTHQVVYHTNAVDALSLHRVFSNSQTFVAQVVSSTQSVLFQSEPLTIDWSTNSIGTNAGHADQKGQTVSVSYPKTAALGTPVTINAVPTGFSSPVYQFWILAPGGSYTSSGNYSSSSSYTFTPNTAGSWQVMVYARESSAPDHETPQQQAVYEAKSNTHFVVVSGS